MKQEKMKTIKLNWSDEIPKNFTGCVEWSDGTKYWYVNGKLHRENDKPAVEYPDGEKRWYLYGYKLNQKQHQHYVELIGMNYEEDVIVWLMKYNGVIKE